MCLWSNSHFLNYLRFYRECQKWCPSLIKTNHEIFLQLNFCCFQGLCHISISRKSMCIYYCTYVSFLPILHVLNFVSVKHDFKNIYELTELKNITYFCLFYMPSFWFFIIFFFFFNWDLLTLTLTRGYKTCWLSYMDVLTFFRFVTQVKLFKEIAKYWLF